jgi:ElaB/YqjD/DUF883 family membrane-anchored ribosome-binding protein
MISDKTTQAISQQTDSLTNLASEINSQHEQAIQHAKSSLEHARRAGELLQQAKQQIEHGKWLDWLASNCKVSFRQAQRYLKVANNWQAIAKNDAAASYLTIDEAIESVKPVKAVPDKRKQKMIVAVGAKAVRQAVKPPSEVLAVDDHDDADHDDHDDAEEVYEDVDDDDDEPANAPEVLATRVPRHAGEHDQSETFALTKADVAITQLKGIPMSNVHRGAALDKVIEWAQAAKLNEVAT